MDELKELMDYPDPDTTGGYTLSALEDAMIGWYKEKYEALTGEEPRLSGADERKLLLSCCAYYLYHSYELVNHYARMGTLKYASGGFLDDRGAALGVKRLKAAGASTTLRYHVKRPRETVTSIPEGSRVTKDGGIYFATTAYAEIGLGQSYADVKAVCLSKGKESNGFLPGELSTMVDVIPFVDAVENITASEGGRDEETDDELRRRIYLAPDILSSGGSVRAYEYMVRDFDPGIADVRITSPSPREVNISVLLAGGTIPQTEYLSQLRSYIMDDGRKMLTDNISILAPKVQSYDIDLTYYINDSDRGKAVLIQSKVNEAIEAYIAWQRARMGRDINPDYLIRLLLMAGAKRAVVKAPVFAVVSAQSVALPGGKSVVYGGIEDD